MGRAGESVSGFAPLNVHLGPIRGKFSDMVTLGDTGSSRACRRPQGLTLSLLHSPLPRVLGRGPPGLLLQCHSWMQQLRPAEALTASPAAEWRGVREWRPGCDQSRGCGQDMELVIFNDKVSPWSLGFLAGYG